MSCPMVVRPSADTVLITPMDSVLIRSQYRHVLWKTLWFLSYLYGCDLHCACWCPASMDARPSADTVLITHIDSVLIRCQYRHVLWKTLWFLSYLYECDLHCACWCPASVDARPSADTVLITQIDSVLIRCQYRHVLWKTLWFLSYLYDCDLHCACWCPASVDARPSADTVLITQIDSVLIRSQYRHVLWKTLWFLSYLYERDLHCACWCPASVDARPSADTVLITQIDSVLIRCQYRHVLWKTLWFLSYLYECDLHCACWCPASVDARPSADTVLITQIDSVLIRSQYRYVLWKTLWFLSYLFECDLYWACWCPASVDARPSADTVLVTQFG